MASVEGAREWIAVAAAIGSLFVHAGVAATGFAAHWPVPHDSPREALVEVDGTVEPVAPAKPSLPRIEPPPPPRDEVFSNHAAASPPEAARVAHASPVAVAASPTSEPAPAANAVVAETALPTFTIAVGNGPDGTTGVVSNQGAATGSPGAPPPTPASDAVLPEQAVSTPARLLRGGAPVYPRRARDEGIEGDLVLELIVSTQGTVESVRVQRSADHGLDEAAVAAVKGYRFTPALKDGHPVRVRMHWTMQFHLE